MEEASIRKVGCAEVSAGEETAFCAQAVVRSPAEDTAAAADTMPSAATPVEGKVEAETPNSTSSSTAAAVYSEGGDARKMQTVCKYLLFSVNCIACVCGLVLFFFGVILEAKHATYFDFLHTSFYAVAVVVGVAVCLVSFLGEFGRTDHGLTN